MTWQAHYELAEVLFGTWRAHAYKKLPHSCAKDLDRARARASYSDDPHEPDVPPWDRAGGPVFIFRNLFPRRETTRGLSPA